MDTVPPREFFRIFDRVSDYVDLEGAYTAWAIRQRIINSKAYKDPVMKYSKAQKKWIQERGGMQRLIEHGFHNKVEEKFLEFRRDSMITLTLLFGKKRAQRMRKKVARAEIGRLAAPIVARGRERREVEEIAKKLTLRERLFGERGKRARRWVE